MGPGWNAKGPAFAASDIDPDTAHPELPQQRARVFCRGAARFALHVVYRKNNRRNFIFGDLSA
jgi:hypothetical protein